jgi:hypothetical protein
MTHISPRATRDMADHYIRMDRKARRLRQQTLLRDILIFAAVITTAALSGWALGAANATLCALPDIITQSQALAAW